MEQKEKCRVLVIDDVPEIQEILTRLLGYERGDEVIYARGGLEGLELAAQNPPQLIILDLMMPDLHGYQVFERLKAMPGLGNIPVLLLTVLPPQLVYPEAQRLGISGYVCKPFEFQELLLARDMVLRGETYFPKPKTGPIESAAAQT